MPDIIVPQPDPTVLTTAQLMREIANARELIESKVSGAVTMLEARISSNASAVEKLSVATDRHMDLETRFQILETRLTGVEKAIDLLKDIQDRVPSLMDEKLNQLKSLHQEKFNSIVGGDFCSGQR
jgi:hypothetical protein